MYFAKVLTKDFDLEDNHVRLGSILTVVDRISDDEKRKEGWWLTPTEIKKGFLNDVDYEVYTDEEPKKIYQFKTGSDSWVSLADVETMQCYASKGFETRTLYLTKERIR